MDNPSTPEVTRADEARRLIEKLAAADIDVSGTAAIGITSADIIAANDWLSVTPARGGDELREELEALFDQAFTDGISVGKSGDESLLAGSAAAYARSALNLVASTDMAGAGERAAVVAFLRRQSDIGANRGNEAEKGTTRRAAYGGGSLALHRAADAIEAGEHVTNDNAAAPPVEGLTSGEGEFDREEIARVLFDQRQTSHDFDEAADDDPESDAGTLRSIAFDDADAVIALLATTPAVHAGDAPIPMILHCPRCHVQHVDEPTPEWDNPPHRSHLCLACGCIWRPADVPTQGVVSIATAGKADTPSVPMEGLTSGEGVLREALQRIQDEPDHILPIVTAQRLRNIAGFALLGERLP